VLYSNKTSQKQTPSKIQLVTLGNGNKLSALECGYFDSGCCHNSYQLVPGSRLKLYF
jgi:hypothetical protein